MHELVVDTSANAANVNENAGRAFVVDRLLEPARRLDRIQLALALNLGNAAALTKRH